jgi:5S rRNA maturation endonuclease (ribonuclease M5)
MNEIQITVSNFLPPKRKNTPSGWISFNAPCCHNRGESKDNRQRGGMILTPDGGFQYHCFNCNFNAGWKPGNLLNQYTKNLLTWLGMNDTDVNKIGLYALKLKDESSSQKLILDLNFDLDDKELPRYSAPISAWTTQSLDEQEQLSLNNIIKYIADRGMQLDWYDWHWSPAKGYTDRLIIPFYNQGKIVGWTGRKIDNGKPKYLTEVQAGYLFNLDNQTYNRKYIIVVEGQLDAIAIDGVAAMHNTLNKTQIARIQSLGKEVIVVPDKDRPGAKLINAALENNWSVSLPPWEEDIKDVADAVKRYGRIYTLFTILHYRETNEIKIQLLKKKLETING